MARLREPRVQEILAPMIAGQVTGDDVLDDDVAYVGIPLNEATHRVRQAGRVLSPRTLAARSCWASRRSAAAYGTANVRRRPASSCLLSRRSARSIIAEYSLPSGSEIVTPLRSRKTSAAARIGAHLASLRNVSSLASMTFFAEASTRFRRCRTGSMMRRWPSVVISSSVSRSMSRSSRIGFSMTIPEAVADGGELLPHLVGSILTNV